MAMKRQTAFAAAVVALGLSLGATASAQTQSTHESRTGSTMAMQVKGAFDVKLTPQGQEDKAEGSTLGRMSIEKHFHGALEGTSEGQMLTGASDVQGSAGYVAMERVSGTLKGLRGSFVLQHSGTMSKNGFQLSITVVPDSGAGELLGLTGKMDIKIVDGKHFYDFEYTLPEAH